MQPLLLVVVTAAALIFCLGVSVAAAATPPSTRLPGSCLMAASSLCSSTNTNALRCLRKLAMKQDARVPASCANALLGGAAASQSQAGRTQRMARMLNEGGCNNCAAAGSGLRCNDVLSECNPCTVHVNCCPPPPQPTHTKLLLRALPSALYSNSWLWRVLTEHSHTGVWPKLQRCRSRRRCLLQHLLRGKRRPACLLLS